MCARARLKTIECGSFGGCRAQAILRARAQFRGPSQSRVAAYRPSGSLQRHAPFARGRVRVRPCGRYHCLGVWRTRCCATRAKAELVGRRARVLAAIFQHHLRSARLRAQMDPIFRAPNRTTTSTGPRARVRPNSSALGGAGSALEAPIELDCLQVCARARHCSCQLFRATPPLC